MNFTTSALTDTTSFLRVNWLITPLELYLTLYPLRDEGGRPGPTPVCRKESSPDTSFDRRLAFRVPWLEVGQPYSHEH